MSERAPCPCYHYLRMVWSRYGWENVAVTAFRPEKSKPANVTLGGTVVKCTSNDIVIDFVTKMSNWKRARRVEFWYLLDFGWRSS